MPDFLYRPLLLAWLLLAGPVAAQPRPSTPQLRQRAVTLPASPEDATVYVARGALTTLNFDSALVPKGVQLAGRDTHFERFVVEERTLTLKPRVELSEGERLVLTVRFADAASPQEATFELVRGTDEIDAQVEVLRRAKRVDVLEVELSEVQAKYAALRDRCGEGGPAGLFLAGALDKNGVASKSFYKRDASTPSLDVKMEDGWGLRAEAWGLVVLVIRNASGERNWGPGAARLVSKSGRPIQVRSVRMDKARLAPGEQGILLVETEKPWWTSGEALRLELQDGNGPRFVISDIQL